MPTKEAQETNAQSIIKEEHIANLVSEKNVLTKKVVRKCNTNKNEIQDIKENVPVPQPAVATKAKKYLASSEEAVIRERVNYMNGMNIEKSISYIKSRGEKLERHVLSSRSDFGYHLNSNNNID